MNNTVQNQSSKYPLL